MKRGKMLGGLRAMTTKPNHTMSAKTIHHEAHSRITLSVSLPGMESWRWSLPIKIWVDLRIIDDPPKAKSFRVQRQIRSVHEVQQSSTSISLGKNPICYVKLDPSSLA